MISHSQASPLSPVSAPRAADKPWRRYVAALDISLNDPALWLVGAAAFMLRGGLLVLLAPLIALPSPVEMRLIIGSGLGSQGFTSALLLLVLGFAVGATLLLMLAMYALSWLELWAFDRVVPAGRGSAVEPRRGAGRVFSVQAAGVSVLALAAVPLLLGAINVAYDELVTPTGGGSLYDRILAGVQGQLLFLGAVIVVVEAATAIASRRALWRSRGVDVPPTGRRWRIVVAALGWAVTAAVVIPSLWALTVTWHAVRQHVDVKLAPTLADFAPEVFILAVVWAATVVLAGFASALRGAVWSVQELR